MQSQFTSNEVVALTGTTARQLQWWDERHIVQPQHKGHRRLYSIENLTEIAVILDLRRRRVPLQRVRKVIRLLQREFGKSLAESVSRRSECHLLTDGNTVYFETSARQVVDILKNTNQPMLAVCLTDKVREVKAEIRGASSALKKRSSAVHAARKTRTA